jgi:hypothetical protein
VRRTLIGLGILTLLGVAPARAVHEKQDFNGDGYGDLVVGAPGEDIGKVKDAGAVNVIYGSPSGPAAAGNQFWTQNSPGVADQAEVGDAFGSSLDVADVNSDGFADLAIGVPGEDLPGKPDNGALHILFGSPAGLRAAGSRFYSDFSPVYEATELDTKEPLCALEVRFVEVKEDFLDRLGVALGCPGADRGKKDSGAVLLLRATDGAALQLLAQGEGGILGVKESNDRFGEVLEVGHFNRDGILDLAVGTLLEDLGKIKDAGAVNVIFGGTDGFTGAGNQFIHQDATLFGVAVAGAAKKKERYGSALAAWRTGPGSDSLVVGVPGEDGGFGTLTIYDGGIAGLQGPGLDLAPILAALKNEDVRSIGAAVVAVDRNFDGFSDLIAAGAPDSSPNAPFSGVACFLTLTAGDFQLDPHLVVGSGEGVYLGAALQALDATDSFFRHLFVSAPGHSDDAGQVLWISLVNFGAFGAFTQDSPGIKDAAEKGDLFGVLAGSRYVGEGH